MTQGQGGNSVTDLCGKLNFEFENFIRQNKNKMSQGKKLRQNKNKWEAAGGNVRPGFMGDVPVTILAQELRLRLQFYLPCPQLYHQSTGLYGIAELQAWPSHGWLSASMASPPATSIQSTSQCTMVCITTCGTIY